MFSGACRQHFATIQVAHVLCDALLSMAEVVGDVKWVISPRDPLRIFEYFHESPSEGI